MVHLRKPGNPGFFVTDVRLLKLPGIGFDRGEAAHVAKSGDSALSGSGARGLDALSRAGTLEAHAG